MYYVYKFITTHSVLKGTRAVTVPQTYSLSLLQSYIVIRVGDADGLRSVENSNGYAGCPNFISSL
jgi:hypothetical protein